MEVEPIGRTKRGSTFAACTYELLHIGHGPALEFPIEDVPLSHQHCTP